MTVRGALTLARVIPEAIFWYVVLWAQSYFWGEPAEELFPLEDVPESFCIVMQGPPILVSEPGHFQTSFHPEAN